MTAKENSNYGTGVQKQTAQRMKKVFCEELETEYESVTQAADTLGLQKSGISKCCKGQFQTCGGYHWRWVDPEVD